MVKKKKKIKLKKAEKLSNSERSKLSLFSDDIKIDNPKDSTHMHIHTHINLLELMIKFVWNHRTPHMAKPTLRKKNKAADILLSDSNYITKLY